MTSPRTTHRRRRMLAAGTALGLATMAAAPAAVATEHAEEQVPALAAEQGTGTSPIGITGMQWASDSLALYRVTNSSDTEVTGQFYVKYGAPRQERTVTVPAKGALFIAVSGTRGTDTMVQFDGPGSWDKQQNINQQLATGHVGITVAPGTNPDRIPVGYDVVAASSIETITWEWDGTTFVKSGDRGGYFGDYVYEDNKLDVPMGQSYSITHDDAAKVTVTVATDPTTIPSFDASIADAAAIDSWGQFWWAQGGKYQENAVTVDATVTEPTPTPTPEPTPTPTPTPEPTQPTVPPTEPLEPEVDEEQEEGDGVDTEEETEESTVESTEELAKTGGSLTAAVLGGALLAGGTGLSLAARRNTSA